jgi:hypothetical protein
MIGYTYSNSAITIGRTTPLASQALSRSISAPFARSTMSSLQQASSLKPNRALHEADFVQLLRDSGKYKERSDRTHDDTHAPLLAQSPTTRIRCLLLGSSMLERFKTTGKHTKLGQVKFPDLLNAGVGGDRIQNVIYRLGTKGLYSRLKQHGVNFVILQMGTNNLRPKRRLSAGAIEEYALVLEALARVAPGIVVLLTGILPRKDVDRSFIDQSNSDLQQLVRDFNDLREVVQGTLSKSKRFYPRHTLLVNANLLGPC